MSEEIVEVPKIENPAPASIEITVSTSGKIPRRNFENYSPMYSIKEIYDFPMSDEARRARQEYLQGQCESLFRNVRESILLEELQSQYKNFDFIKCSVCGKGHPRVTDIIYWDAEFYINPDELTQHGALGSALHELINHYIKTGVWGPFKDVISKRHWIIIDTGNLKLVNTLDQFDFVGFMQKFGDDIEFTQLGERAFNHEHFYCGEPDYIGKYKGIPTIFDFKKRAIKDSDFKQMAAYIKLENPLYANCVQMVGIPINASNKSGYGKPVVSDEVENYFNLFLRDRQDFKHKFGV